MQWQTYTNVSLIPNDGRGGLLKTILMKKINLNKSTSRKAGWIQSISKGSRQVVGCTASRWVHGQSLRKICADKTGHRLSIGPWSGKPVAAWLRRRSVRVSPSLDAAKTSGLARRAAVWSLGVERTAGLVIDGGSKGSRSLPEPHPSSFPQNNRNCEKLVRMTERWEIPVSRGFLQRRRRSDWLVRVRMCCLISTRQTAYVDRYSEKAEEFYANNTATTLLCGQVWWVTKFLGKSSMQIFLIVTAHRWNCVYVAKSNISDLSFA